MNFVNNIRRAADWLDNNSTDDFAYVSNVQRIKYPEVTGYFIPTLRRMGFHDKARSFAEHLADIQGSDGGWGLGGKNYIFDTAQIIDGLSEFKEYSDEIEKAIDYIDGFVSGGKIENQYKKGKISNHIFPRMIWCLKKVGYDTSEMEKINFNKDTRIFNCLSHFYCYSFEGYARMNKNCTDFIDVIKKYNNIIPETHSVETICYTGLSQSALSLFLCEELDIGMKALEFATDCQNDSGGFFGSNGKYFPQEEISWAVKFYIDACFEASYLDFKKNKNKFKSDFEGGYEDPRLAFVRSNIKKDDSVLDVGCGKGRYVKNISCLSKNAIDIVEVDIGDDILFSIGSCLNIPFDDNEFDKIICAEAIEHAVFQDLAIKEMIRVVKKGGSILIVDKDGDVESSSRVHFMEEWPKFNKLLKGYDYTKEPLDVPGSNMPFVGVVINVK